MSQINSDKKIIIFYHRDCPDGFSAAWAAWRKFSDGADYIPLGHDDPVPINLENKDIFFLDIVFKSDVMRNLVSKNKVIAIDHHQTAEEAIKIAGEYRYDLNHSGAVLAWEYFHPREPIPKLLAYVEDRDLWKNILPDTETVCAAIDSAELSFDNWSKLAGDFDDPEMFDYYVEKGASIRDYEKGEAERLIKNHSELVTFDGHDVYCINAPDFMASRIGSMLIKEGRPFAIVWFRTRNRIKVSLRSDKEKFDVGQLAQRYGGGGHKGAAGFSLDTEFRFPWQYKHE